MLYEGTNGVQALDLVGRKLPKDGGRALQAFFAEVTAYAKERGADAAMTPYVKPLSQSLGDLQQATMWFLQNALGNPDNAGAGATDGKIGQRPDIRHRRREIDNGRFDACVAVCIAHGNGMVLAR